MEVEVNARPASALAPARSLRMLDARGDAFAAADDLDAGSTLKTNKQHGGWEYFMADNEVIVGGPYSAFQASECA